MQKYWLCRIFALSNLAFLLNFVFLLIAVLSITCFEQLNNVISYFAESTSQQMCFIILIHTLADYSTELEYQKEQKYF